MTYDTNGTRAHSIKDKDYRQGLSIYSRVFKIEGEREQYGTYYQAVRSYREWAKVKQEAIHLGEHETAEAALAAWPRQLHELERVGRPKKAKTLRRKLDRLQELTEGGDVLERLRFDTTIDII